MGCMSDRHLRFSGREDRMEKCGEIYTRVAVQDLLEDEDTIWMSLADRNGICKKEKKDPRAFIIGTFPKEELTKSELYFGAEKAGDKLVFVPNSADYIAIYSLTEGSVQYIPLEMNRMEEELKQDGKIKFWGRFHVGEIVYLLGYRFPAIIRIDTNTMDTLYITDWRGGGENQIFLREGGGFFSEGCIVKEEKALIPMACMNAVLELDLLTSRTRILRLDISGEGISGMASSDGENIWIAGIGKSALFCWNLKNRQIDKIVTLNSTGQGGLPFHAPVCTDSRVYLMPIWPNHIYEVDINARRISTYDALEEKITGIKNKKNIQTIAPRMEGELLKFIVTRDFKWYEFNTKTGECKSFYLRIENTGRWLNEYFDCVFSKEQYERAVFGENEMSLPYFLSRVEKGNLVGASSRNNLCYGSQIYHMLWGNEK